MSALGRRRLLKGTVATTAALEVGAPAVHAQKGRRALRFVAQADLGVVHPIWTTGYITRNHGTWCTTPSWGQTSTSSSRPPSSGT
jgi:peptide/nickel transport system substrate-binding protein